MSDTKHPRPDTVEMEDLDQFVRALVAWHTARCAAVRKLQEVPEGSEFQIEDEINNQSVVLTGSTMIAFKLGIEMALMELGSLPFVAEVEEAPVLT
jgi:hypothetical protein